MSVNPWLLTIPRRAALVIFATPSSILFSITTREIDVASHIAEMRRMLGPCSHNRTPIGSERQASARDRWRSFFTSEYRSDAVAAPLPSSRKCRSSLRPNEDSLGWSNRNATRAALCGATRAVNNADATRAIRRPLPRFSFPPFALPRSSAASLKARPS